MRADSWFTLEVIAEASHIIVKINGRTTADYSSANARFSFLSGPIAVQQFDRRTKVEFRNIEIKELNGKAASGSPSGPGSPPTGTLPPVATADAPRADGFISLFNGKDLSGWRLLGNPKHTWKVIQGGILEGSGSGPPPGPSHVVTERADFSNFHLRVETRIAEGQSSAIGFRITEGEGASGMYLAHIAGTDQGEIATGSLRCSMFGQIMLAKADPVVPIKPGEWFTEEVIADGEILTVIVNGSEVAKFKILQRKLMSGAIGLLCRGHSGVAFRKIEIKKLNGPGLDGSPAGGVESEKAPDRVDWSHMAFITGGADWQLDGNELVHTTLEGTGSLLFGDPTWTDYTFSADVKIVQSTGEVGLIFRDGGEPTLGKYYYNGGLPGVYNGAIGFSSKGNLPARRNGNTNLARGKWHKMRINVQGNRLTAYLDARVVMVTTNSAKTRGSVGFCL